MATNQDMIGRDEINDLEAILSITNSDVDEVLHTVQVGVRRAVHLGLRALTPGAR